MPDRYHIHTAPVTGRFHRIGKFGIVDCREDCSRCSNCVKVRCNFDVYKHESAHSRNPLDSVQTLNECKACFSCVQGCTKGLLNLSVNPEFLDIGDDYWTPDLILSTWNQADSGEIPVSGAGYRGRFHGPGFDSIWTDMSEIVRPTRDGIHGREYISTSVDIGPKPMRLNFSPDGKMLTEPPALLEAQLPVVLDVPPWPLRQMKLAEARAMAAKELKTFAAVWAREAELMSPELLPFVVPVFKDEDVRCDARLENIRRMVQLIDGSEALESMGRVMAAKPQAILSIRMMLGPETTDRILELSGHGLKVFHICADQHGREHMKAGAPGRHIKDMLREMHSRLVTEGVRDEITLIVSGGIALAEHMAKAILCGTDLVAADTALLAALGCRVCRHAHPSDSDGSGEAYRIASPGVCSYGIDSVDSHHAAQRIVNLMGAWHGQLIEVLGAMGIRDVRRLRGEMGRAIFMEEIEIEAFGDLLRVSPRQETV